MTHGLEPLESWIHSSPDIREHVEAVLACRAHSMMSWRRAPPRARTLGVLLDVLGEPRMARADWDSPSLHHLSVVLVELSEGALDPTLQRRLPGLAKRLSGHDDPTFEVGAHQWVDFASPVLQALQAGLTPWVYWQPWSAMDVRRWSDIGRKLTRRVLLPPPTGWPADWRRLFIDIRLIPGKATNGAG